MSEPLPDTTTSQWQPRRFRILLPEGERHPNGSVSRYRYGCYFPLTDLVVGDMGERGTGKPTEDAPHHVEWMDL